MNRKRNEWGIAGLIMAVGLAAGPVQAGWQDLLKGVLGGGEEETAGSEDAGAETAPASTTTMPDRQAMTQAVLEALQVGVRRAVDTLGQQGGFLQDQAVRIPLPGELRQVESVMRKLGQDRYADDFIRSMNRAAEQAVPQTTDILIDTIKGMSVSDASNIVQGPEDAATTYFREHASDRLGEVIRPIVTENMDKVGVTSYYKKFISQAGFLQSYVGEDTLDLDTYVTNKTLDGLFTKLAVEEKRIREQPVARTTDILKSVFGYFDK